MNAAVFLLDNPVRQYPWGSRSAIASLRGAPPTVEPEAELWMGAHPSDPSQVILESGPVALDRFVADNPEVALGPVVAARSGGRLPFLLKILAADAPLSLQAHPDRAQAQLGYAAENERGVALDAPTRSYRDRNQKPELLCALTRFEALCGFRPAEEIARFVDRLQEPLLNDAFADLRDQVDVHAPLVRHFLSSHAEDIAPLAAALRRGLDRLVASAAPDDADVAMGRWLARLAEQHPDDGGVLVALLLNHIVLEPGQAVFLAAGKLHTYLSGTGIELMANSDNVLRGGLTTKHIDVPELLRILDPRDQVVRVLEPHAVGEELVYSAMVPEFRLSRLDLEPGDEWRGRPWGPEILLQLGRGAEVVGGGRTVQLGPAQAAFVAGDLAEYHLRGDGPVYRAAVPRTDPTKRRR